MPKISVGETDVLILCGGLGTRFRQVQDDIPKALAPIQGTPFIDLLLKDLVDQGFRRIILATGHLSSQLEQYVQRRRDAEYIISCEPKPMGTGGAIKLAEQHIRSDIFLILNGDSRILLGYKDMMNFWNNLFKNKIYNIKYENLIKDNEKEIKNLINYCDLEWDENCMSFYNNKKSVSTASLAQVRNPIYKSSIEKWKNYSEELKELSEFLTLQS